MTDPPDSASPPAMGRYRLVRRLAVGGMAEIFLARAASDDGFEKAVVVKRILPQYAADGQFVRMFLDEARLAAGLHHAHIAQVYDFGREGGWPFYTMEYVHGVDLGQLWRSACGARGEPLPLEHALTIAAAIAAGLHHAHEQRDDAGNPLGIVHRDVTPSNVLVGFDGSVKLSDFGIAKMRHGRNETAPGAVRGKLAYMAPEQLTRGPVDRRCDLYALGVLLFEMTTGTLLWDATDEPELLRQRLEGTAAPPQQRRAGYPDDLARVVTTCLATDPDDRYPTAHALREALEAVARARALPLSPLALGDYLGGVFPEQVARWRGAERAGTALVDFVAPTGEAPTPVLRAVLADEGPRTEALPARRPHRLRSVAALVLVVGTAATVALLRDRGVQPADAGASTLWAGAWHTCALGGESGALHCWGKNNEGQLGVGSTLDLLVPRPVRGLERPPSFSAGFFHACACTADGQARCWGRNDEGQLGRQGNGAPVPVPVAGVEDCAQISAGLFHTCAVRRGGAVVCWGRNDRGQTGRPASEPVRRPAEVPGVAGAVQVATGGQLFPDEAGGFTCVLDGRGQVFCFGDNGHGQLGDGTTISRSAPAPVVGVDDAVELSTAGGSFVCARRRAGTVACWGRNLSGVVPGAAPAQPRAVDVPGLDGVVALATGLGHACALRRSGEVLCWGHNNHGQLGDGGQRARAEPRPVPGIERAVAIAAGEVHTCARHAAGLACWGANQTGQLGDGTAKQKLTPVSVVGFPGPR